MPLDERVTKASPRSTSSLGTGRPQSCIVPPDIVRLYCTYVETWSTPRRAKSARATSANPTRQLRAHSTLPTLTSLGRPLLGGRCPLSIPGVRSTPIFFNICLCLSSSLLAALESYPEPKTDAVGCVFFACKTDGRRAATPRQSAVFLVTFFGGGENGPKEV